MVTVSFPVAAIKYPGKSGVREKGSLFVFPSQFVMVGKRGGMVAGVEGLVVTWHVHSGNSG